MRAKKSLGQNFISDPGLICEIADAARIEENDTVVEIGAGRGALTDELAGRAKRVIAVELDKDLIPVLKTIAALRGNIEVVNCDILEYDFTGLHGIKIVGNLPYYITTPIILGLLEKGVDASFMTLMVQKEVAERIVSPPGSRDYGVLSVSIQYYCNAEYVLDVPAEYFSPKPKVDSALLRLTKKPVRLLSPEDEPLFFELVKTVFTKRRKTLQNSLSSFRGITKEEAGALLENCGIEKNRRAETLSLEEFARLCDFIKEKENA